MTNLTLQQQDIETRKSPIIILAGPTATGKTQLALDLSSILSPKFQLEIINADSLSFYRNFNIGAAKPTAEQILKTKHHLLDIADPHQRYTAADFLKDVEKTLEEILITNAIPIIVGGSGFYLKALLFGLWKAPPANSKIRESLSNSSNDQLYDNLIQIDSENAVRIGKNDRYRLIRAIEIFQTQSHSREALQKGMPKFANPRFELWAVDRADEELSEMVSLRTQSMLNNGMIEETKIIREKFPNAQGLQSIGYSQVCRYLDQLEPPGRKIRSGLDGLRDEIELATRQLIRKQRMWLKNLPVKRRFLLDLERQKFIDDFVSCLS